MALYIDRHIEQQIIVASKHYPVIMVCGQQQVGKSTMLNHIKGEHRRYVTLDDGNSHRLTSADPALFFETYGAPLLIDEIQKVPSLLLEMKQIVDEKALAGEYTRGIFWTTGSQKFQMRKDQSVQNRIGGGLRPPGAADLHPAPVPGGKRADAVQRDGAEGPLEAVRRQARSPGSNPAADDLHRHDARRSL